MAGVAVSESLSNQERVIVAVKRGIDEGRYAEGFLPSYRQLARELSVPMSYVRRAMSLLEKEGIVRREKRRGVLPLRRSPAADTAVPSSIRYVTFIGVAPPDSNFLETTYLKGHADALEGRHVRTRHLSLMPDARDISGFFGSDRPREGEGFMLVSDLNPVLMQWLSDRQAPYVVQCYARYNRTGMPEHHSIYVNKVGGVFEAVNHLLSLGHRRIGFIGCVEPPDDPSTRPLDGYRAAMECAGLGFDRDDVAPYGGDDPAAVVPLATSLLQRSDRPSAVMASNDNIALGVLQAARAMDLRVPEDLSVVGLNDQPGVEQADPPLTTISIPRRQLARDAVEMLFEVAERQGGFEQRVLECHLIVRKSTAPPAAPPAPH